MTSGIKGTCECPLGKHHVESCPNYIDVWRTCPCPECTFRREFVNEFPPPEKKEK